MVSLLTNFTSNRMVVRLMIILTWICATVSGRTGGLKADYPRHIVAWLVLVSQKTVSISALMGCCCAGLGMRHSPPRPGQWPSALYLIFCDAAWCLVSLVYCRAGGEKRGGRPLSTRRLLGPGSSARRGQANPGVTGDSEPRA